MKKIAVIISLVTLFFTLSSGFASAQSNVNPDCLKYFSFYKDYYKVKNHDDAIRNWRKAFKYCEPTFRQTLITDGTALMRREIAKNKKDALLKEALIDTLMMLHDLRLQHYPKYKTVALNNKVLDMIQYRSSDTKVLYEQCKEVIAVNAVKTKASIFVNYMNASVELYQSAAIDIDQVITDYEVCMTNLDAMLQADPSDKNAETIRDAVENLFVSSRVASCENLLAIFTPKYEEDPTNVELLNKIGSMLRSAEECTDNDLYFSVVTGLYNSDPSHKSAYAISRMHSARGDVDNANKFLQEAIDFEESVAEEDAQYYYEMAILNHKDGNKAKAYSSALKCIELDADKDVAGKAYMLCGTIWGSTSCKGGNDIQARSPFWVAVDFMYKAKSADETLAEEADRMIAQYRQYFPEKSEAFMYNLTDGETYRVSCGGLTATTTVRTQSK